MKRFSLSVCLFTFVLLSLSNAYSLDSKDNNPQKNESVACEKKESAPFIDTTDMRYGKTPLNKLGRGVINVSTFYLEIPAAVFRVSDETNNEILGVTLGTAEGLFTALLRGMVGLYDTVTFLIPSYSKTLMKPEYAIDSMDQAYNQGSGY